MVAMRLIWVWGQRVKTAMVRMRLTWACNNCVRVRGRIVNQAVRIQQILIITVHAGVHAAVFVISGRRDDGVAAGGYGWILHPHIHIVGRWIS